MDLLLEYTAAWVPPLMSSRGLSLSHSPWSGSVSIRCRLFLRDGGGKLPAPPLDRRRWRLDRTEAGDTIAVGGTFPVLWYSSSISLRWAACSACTSCTCLQRAPQERTIRQRPATRIRQEPLRTFILELLRNFLQSCNH